MVLIMKTTMGKMIADVSDNGNKYTTELHYIEKNNMITTMWNLSGQLVTGYDGDNKVYLLEKRINEVH